MGSSHTEVQPQLSPAGCTDLPIDDGHKVCGHRRLESALDAHAHRNEELEVGQLVGVLQGRQDCCQLQTSWCLRGALATCELA